MIRFITCFAKNRSQVFHGFLVNGRIRQDENKGPKCNLNRDESTLTQEYRTELQYLCSKSEAGDNICNVWMCLLWLGHTGSCTSTGSGPGRLGLVICCVLIFSEHYTALALSLETQNPFINFK